MDYDPVSMGGGEGGKKRNERIKRLSSRSAPGLLCHGHGNEHRFSCWPDTPLIPFFPLCAMQILMWVEGLAMSVKEYQLPETFLKVIKEDREYGIFLLEGEKLILFPA